MSLLIVLRTLASAVVVSDPLFCPWGWGSSTSILAFGIAPNKSLAAASPSDVFFNCLGRLKDLGRRGVVECWPFCQEYHFDLVPYSALGLPPLCALYGHWMLFFRNLFGNPFLVQIRGW